MPWSASWLMQSPAWLWLLCALAIPVLIHLVRRSNPQQITFAAVQWLQQKRQRQWNKLHLRDKLLLLLRLLLLGLLVLLLVRPLLVREALPSDTVVIVDPQVAPDTLENFLSEHPRIHSAFWLQAEPIPVSEPRPAPADLWQTLSKLAASGEFRRAHILLQSAQIPSGHNTLRISPHWQWHAADGGEKVAAEMAPRIALLGEGPRWLQPAVQQLAATAMPQLALQRLGQNAALDAGEIDWLFYDVPGTLPQPVHEFVRAGGLLITDAHVTPGMGGASVTSAPGPGFAAVAGAVDLEAAAIGHGSWLRYRANWHSEDFFRKADLPRQLWRQWSAQDWLWLHRARSHWSVAAPPGVALADSEVSPHYQVPVKRPLLLAFALLLLLERATALARPTPQAHAGKEAAGDR